MFRHCSIRISIVHIWFLAQRSQHLLPVYNSIVFFSGVIAVVLMFPFLFFRIILKLFSFLIITFLSLQLFQLSYSTIFFLLQNIIYHVIINSILKTSYSFTFSRFPLNFEIQNDHISIKCVIFII